MVMVSRTSLKGSVKHILNLIGYTVVRVDRTFGSDPLVDVLYDYPERSIKTALDVGANVGSVATRMAKRFPDARVLAFEPIASTFATLKSKTDRLSAIEAFQVAVGDREGEETVFRQDHSEWNSFAATVNYPNATARSVVVQIRTLDRMADEGFFASINILKTDTEGFDLKLLGGAKALPGRGRIGCVLSEVAYDTEDKRHTNFFAINDYLTNYGFRLFAIYDQTIAPKTRNVSYCNALFVAT